ncbi:MAG: DNA polymerase [Planctomycetota bacterium]|jgi:hypothetical protein
MQLVFDIETNGLMDREDLKVHCLVAQDVETEKVWRFADTYHGEWNLDGRISDGLEWLVQADRSEDGLLIGHFIAGFDIPVLDRLYPGWRPAKLGRWFDTKRVSEQVWPGFQIVKKSAQFRNAIGGRSEKKREEAYPRKLLNIWQAHRLVAWGYRLKMQKGSFLDDMGVQEDCSKPLIDYCERDVRVNRALFLRLRASGMKWDEPAMPLEAAICESQFSYLMEMQHQNGVGFDDRRARALYSDLLARQTELEAELHEKFFPDWWSPDIVNGDSCEEMSKVRAEMEKEGTKVAAYKVPKRTYKVPYPHNLAGRESGCAFTPVVKKTFNVNADVANRLQAVYGWEPEEFTDTGDPKTDDTVIGGLTYPCVPLIREALTVNKRIGQLAEGKKAWLKLAKNGRLHGKVHPSGTRTSRCTHTDPNAAQVPTVKAKYGVECRGLFRPTQRGWRMMGCDASGIELRMLGNRMAFYDDGALAQIILHGDIHDEWQEATGLFYRDYQKNVSYSYIYGAQGKTVGMYVLKDWRKAFEEGLTDKPPPSPEFQEKVGQDARQALQDRTPGLDQFVRDCYKRHKRGYILSIDGRVIRTKTNYGVVNDVLQSDAGIIMKYAAVLRYDAFVERGWVLGKDYEFLLNVHDEWQDGVRPEITEEFGAISVDAIRRAGEHLKLRLPLDGEYKVGDTWADTH